METMIAFAVLAITFLGLIQLMSVGLQQNSRARSSTMLVAVAQQQLEQLRTKHSKELESGTASSDLAAGSHGPLTVTLAAPSDSVMADNLFQVTWDVAISGQQKTVTVNVVPQSQNELVNETLSVASVFVP